MLKVNGRIHDVAQLLFFYYSLNLHSSDFQYLLLELARPELKLKIIKRLKIVLETPIVYIINHFSLYYYLSQISQKIIDQAFHPIQ